MDFISVNTFWTILLIIHGLLAVALRGALTHQAVAVLMPVRQVAGPPGFVTRFRAVTADQGIHRRRSLVDRGAASTRYRTADARRRHFAGARRGVP